MSMLIPAKTALAQYEQDFPNEFIFQVTLPPQWLISEALFAYEVDGKYYLPINELADSFNFFIDTEIDRGNATGFAGNEENTFSIDQGRNEFSIKGEINTLGEDAILVSEFLATDDLYVQLEVLNAIWPVNMRIELATLSVVVEAEETLPFVQKRIREDKLQKVASRKEEAERRSKILPRRENPYKMLGKPVIDYQATYTFDDENKTLTGSNVFTGVQQIGKLLAEFSANFRMEDNPGEDKKIVRPDNVRLLLSRKSAGEEYLVPGVRNFQAGDVSLRQRNLISNTENGRGVFVSNDNNDRFNEFDTITIEGTGPPGWDIELYNNDQIIEFSQVPENGQYFFEDITLNFGNNLIKILLFGPQGQVREETRSFVAGGNMLSPGNFIYNAGFADSNREFILLDNEARSSPRGVVKTVETSYGVNQWLTMFGNFSEIPEQDETHTYVTFGGVASTPIGLVEAEAYNEIGGGNALALDYITEVLGVRSNIGAAIYNDFESTDSGFDEGVKTFETSAQFNKNVNIFSLPLGLRLNTLHTERKTGSPVTNVDTAQTISRAGVRLSHNTTSRFTDYAHDTSSGSLTTTVREGPWQLRGSFNYSIYPEFDLSSVTSDLRYRT
ncbi:MAG: hypothetical protein AAF182_03720, partial [Pseudomonadota bacterium]